MHQVCPLVGLMTNISHDVKTYKSKKYAFLAFSNLLVLTNNNKSREDKGDREGILHTHLIPQVIRLELFLESG